MKIFTQYKNVLMNKTYHLINKRIGWKTNRKIIVIESDDWGSVRMPNLETYQKVIESGIRVDLSHYNKYDTLASNDDFDHLYNILSKHKDFRGNHPVLTLNTIVANPDFNAIKRNNFDEYFYEPFFETLKRYQNRSFEAWLTGIDNKLIYPQLHGREHLNVELWMRYLKKGSKEVHFAFEKGLYGIGSNISKENNPSFVQAFESNTFLKNHSCEAILSDAFKLFENAFGYKSRSFISPNYIWNKEIENILNKFDVNFLQGEIKQKTPVGEKYNYLGKRNSNNQIYLIRNVIFEPSSNENYDWVNHALKQIENTFKSNQPATITMHRVNFVGAIFEQNRIRNLKLFDDLLRKIKIKWPQVEFLNSVELGNAIINSTLKKK